MYMYMCVCICIYLCYMDLFFTPPEICDKKTKIRRAENKKSQNSAKNSAIIN